MLTLDNVLLTIKMSRENLTNEYNQYKYLHQMNSQINYESNKQIESILKLS